MKRETARERRIAALQRLAATGEFGLPKSQFAEIIPRYPAATIRRLVELGLVTKESRMTVTPKGLRLLADVAEQGQ